MHEFCENQRSGRHTFLEGVNKVLSLFYAFFSGFGILPAQKIFSQIYCQFCENQPKEGCTFLSDR
jgi:hypothetical protein